MTATIIWKTGAQGLLRESSLLIFLLSVPTSKLFFFKLPIRLFLLPSVKARQKKKNILCFICIPVLLFWFTIAFLSFGGGALERFVAAGSE